jgi:hypothetical protein
MEHLPLLLDKHVCSLLNLYFSLSSVFFFFTLYVLSTTVVAKHYYVVSTYIFTDMYKQREVFYD